MRFVFVTVLLAVCNIQAEDSVSVPNVNVQIGVLQIDKEDGLESGISDYHLVCKEGQCTLWETSFGRCDYWPQPNGKGGVRARMFASGRKTSMDGELQVKRSGLRISVITVDSNALGTTTTTHNFDFADDDFSKLKGYSGTITATASEVVAKWDKARKVVFTDLVPLKGGAVSQPLGCGILLFGLSSD